jgi:hypothetical protein
MHFVFPYRIARLSYLLRNIVLAAIAAIFAPSFENDGGGGDITAGVFAVGLLALYWGVFVVAPRCRDSGLSPWAALLLLVPGANLFLGGYLSWKPSWPLTDGLNLSSASGTPTTPGSDAALDHGQSAKSDALRRLEALRDEGVLTEQDFLRRKARLGKNGYSVT